MLATLRTKNQITLPNDIIKTLDLHKDDPVDITVNNYGQILITPVVTVEKQFVNDMRDSLNEVKEGKVSKAMPVDDLIDFMGLE